ncbi:MAG: redox-regulated ATPase YchF [Candidatus Aenigmarchaeota archaeon]|nr:redox-regulated ATPase YchF [Candidatus Aenigmarchaeota archaeon]
MIIGLIGKPSAGKSSFFKAATMIDVKTSSVPFTTINPNKGVAYVTIDCICKEFNTTCKPKHGVCKNGKRYIPVNLVDVGGLIPGSHLGKGIGNKFLDDIRQASVMIQIIDASGMTDEEGKPTENFDPTKEIEFLREEIDLWFESVVKRNIEKLKLPSSESDLIVLLQEKLSGLGVTRNEVSQTLQKYTIEDMENFSKELRRISKPFIIAANKIDLKPSQENYEKLKKDYSNMIPTSAESEIALKKADEKYLIKYNGNSFEIVGELDSARKVGLEYIKSQVLDKFNSTGVQECLNKSVFDILNYIAVYPVADANKLTDKDGNKLPDVILVPNGTTMKEFAFKVHTELGNKFITGVDARTKLRLGADHQLKHKDVVSIVFGK